MFTDQLGQYRAPAWWVRALLKIQPFNPSCCTDSAPCVLCRWCTDVLDHTSTRSVRQPELTQRPPKRPGICGHGVDTSWRPCIECNAEAITRYKRWPALKRHLLET